MPREPLEYKGKVIKVSGGGILIGVDGEEIWFPRSQLQDGGDLHKDSDEGDEGSFLIPEWLAIEKELE
jgi:hypothetical protein